MCSTSYFGNTRRMKCAEFCITGIMIIIIYWGVSRSLRYHIAVVIIYMWIIPFLHRKNYMYFLLWYIYECLCLWVFIWLTVNSLMPIFISWEEAFLNSDIIIFFFFLPICSWCVQCCYFKFVRLSSSA